MGNIRDGTQQNHKEAAGRLGDKDKTIKKNYPVVIITLLMIFFADCGAAALILALLHGTFDIIFSWQPILVFAVVFFAMEIVSYWLHGDQL